MSFSNNFSTFLINKRFFRFLNKNYDPTAWGMNGPTMFTASLRKFCSGINIESNKFTQCGNFTTLPSEKCFAIPYPIWHWFYQEEFANNVFNRLKNSKSYFVHMHNKMLDFGNKTFDLRYDSEAAYIQLAKKYCPKVYDTLVRFF